MDYSLKIPYEERSKFAEPLGELISGSRKETIPRVVEKIKQIEQEGNVIRFYIVGDIVTQDFLANAYLKSFIQICIIDEKTQRKHIEINAGDFFEHSVELENPAGTIDKKSWSMIEEILNNKKRTLITITEGEEDLLVLPLVMNLPIKEGVLNYVFYGQPPITDAKRTIPEGVVMTLVGKATQEIVKNLLDIMETI